MRYRSRVTDVTRDGERALPERRRILEELPGAVGAEVVVALDHPGRLVRSLGGMP